MAKLGGYLRTAGQYFADPKGRHDVLDYLRAAGLIFLTAAAATYLVRLLA